MNAPLWLQAVTASALTIVLVLLVLLVKRTVHDRKAEEAGVEMHVTPYIRKPGLLTPAEQRFYARLYQAVGGELLIWSKVRLADVMEVRGEAIEWQAAWNKIAAKHLDFLLTTADDFQPLLAIELDDSSHMLPARQKRDEWLDRALVAAGLPILRVQARRDYDPGALRRHIEQKLYGGVQ